MASLKKKKKGQATENVSFTDYTKSVLGRDDIEAPTYKTYKVTDDDDIAPVKTDERKWFEKGAFEDGYQFGDITKTILGTGADIGKNLTTGIVGMGEKVLDAGMTLGSMMNQQSMNQAAQNEMIFNALSGKKESAENTLNRYQVYQDKVEEETGKFVAKDLYDEEKVAEQLIKPSLNYGIRKLIGAEDEEEFSVLGEKSDALVQSAGQLGATAALQAVGVPWWLTTGATTFGSEAENAFNQGADFNEAVLSSTISAGAEILTEKLSGGIKFGGKTVDELWLKPLTNKISNKVFRTLVKLGADATGESFEELASGVLSNLGTALYKEEDLEDILASEEALNEYVESMVGGFVLGGGMSGVNAIKSKVKGEDFASGLTNNEKAVVDKIYNDTIAEEEKNGKKLTEREKSKIYDGVLEQMEKGYISTDTIEEVLGGDTYKFYKETADNEEALQKEFNELNQMKQGEMTGEQIDRRNELKQQLAELKETSNKDNLKTKLFDDTYELVKDSKLAESYNEKIRRGQSFEADLSQYEEKYRGTIKKAAESGILNNTRRTHEMVDFIAKISADKGVLFDFTDNEKLKNSSYAVDGKTVNGFVDENGNVVLNINSAKSLNSTAGHEITHILEGTELYQPLSDIITEYAKTKGEYDSRLEALNKLYEGVYKGEDFADKVNKELVADLVGDYIFTDKAFVQKLSTENRNIFEKIYDEIKYLCKVATAGSKEARELEKVKKTFTEVYRESGKAQSDIEAAKKYSLSDNEGTKLSKEQQDFFKDSKMRDDNGNLKVMYHGSEYAGFHEFNSKFSDDDTSFFFVDRNDVAQTYSGSSEVYTARSFNTVEEFNNFFEEIDSEEFEVVKQGDKYALLENGDVEVTSPTLKGLYDEFCDYTGLGQGSANYKVYLNLTNPLVVNAEGRNWNRISGEFSQEIYDRIKALTEAEKTALTQLASWEDSSVFRDELQTAAESVERGANYVDDYIRNLANAVEKLGDTDMYRLFDIATDNFSEESLRENAVKYLNTRDYSQRAKEQGYDGVIFKNIVDNGGFADGKEGASTVAIAFNSSQIKSVANEKPTGNADIRYSISEETDNEYMSAVKKGDTETAQMLVDEAAKNSMPNSKVRDENGNLLTVYHGSPSKFTVFKHSKMNTHGNAHGRGFYFTEDKNMAEGYEQDGGQLLKGYLNIEKPLSEDKVTIKRADLIKLIKATCKDEAQSLVEDGGYDSIREALPDTWVSNYVDTYNTNINDVYREVANIIYSGNDNDVDIIAEITNGGAGAENTLVNTYKVLGYDGVIYTNDFGTHEFVSLISNQFKSSEAVTYDDNGDVIPLSQRFNPENDDIRYSLSEQGEAPTKYGSFNIYGDDVKLETQEDIAPVKNAVEDENTYPDDFAPVTEEMANEQAHENLETISDVDAPMETEEEYYELPDTTALDTKTLKNIGKSLRETLYLNPSETRAIQEIVQKYSTEEFPSEEQLFEEIKEQYGEKVWTEKVQEIADVKRFLRGYKIKVSQKIKDGITDYSAFRKSNQGKVRFSRDGLPVDIAYQELKEIYPEFFPSDIANATDELLKIVEVANMEAKRVEHYKLDNDTIQDAVDIITGEVSTYKETTAQEEAETIAKESLDDIAPLKAEQVIGNANKQNDTLQQPVETVEYRQEKKLRSLEKELADNKQLRSEAIKDYSDRITRLAEEYAALKDTNSRRANDIVRSVTRLERLKANVDADYSKRISGLETRIAEMKQNVKTDRVANVLVDEPSVEEKKNSGWQKFKTSFLDKGSVFEDLALKSKNRKIQAKYNFLHYSEGTAQRLIGKGTKGVKALNDIRATVESTGKTEDFYNYLYHKHNIDRMSLEDKYDDVENKPVFGDYVTAETSKEAVKKYEADYPMFEAYAKDVYTYMEYLRKRLVDKGVISQETADLWAEMYPHYVPIRRVGESGQNINVALDTNKTGVNAPIKRATGGNSDILPLFDTMAMRTLQTFKAAARNSFGVELKNALGTTIEKTPTDIDGIIDSVDSQEELLQEGKNGQAPTFTVFENGERVTFEITEDMYDALKPTSKGLAYTNKFVNAISNKYLKGVLTEYNPVFMFTNAIKDTQDVLINSQHPAKTYANVPQAIFEMISGKGQYYTEYIENGGEQNTYFEKQSNTFAKDKSTLRKIVGFPLDKISEANNFIERIPRLAEYIASRKSGSSVEVAMLDSARVTTNFAAGGDVTKFLNRNGFTFLNASVQGAMQQVRNVREAKANGLKGWAHLVTKVALAGLPAMLLNGLLWDDDEDYEELSDYVKDNYYVVAKTENGQFIRIPKGRALAVIQDAFEQIGNAITGNDEVDLKNFLKLVVSNIAPNNPIDNNIIAPLMQVKNNETWYGEDLVPTRLQDVPTAEQYDESTDLLSKWLGEKLNYSPYKLNYLLNQYSGGIGDVILPMLTPEAESGDNSFGGNLLAPFKDKFKTDSVTNNQNVSDFYDTVDELTKNANSIKATDEDVLKSKYMNSVNSELGELYTQKREIQSSSLPDDVKYQRVQNIQKQINNLARTSLNSYESVNIQGKYATVGDQHFRWYEPSDESSAEAGWQKTSGKQLEKQEEVTSGLGISASAYWSNKEEYDYAYEYPENYAVAKSVGGYEAYKTYTSELYDIKADKDKNGKSISGSRKEKVVDYINNLDIDYYEKIILLKNEYNADDTYNYEIIDYLNGREDISYEEMEIILKKLGFTVSANGKISW